MSSLLDVFDTTPDPKPSSLPSTPPPSVERAATPSEAPKPAGPIFGHGLSDDTRQAAQTAADAVDAEAATKAALDVKRDVLQAKMEQELLDLEKAYKDAKTRRIEAEAVLMKVMGIEKITKIPMDDRPDIQIKTIPGRKKNITKSWLDDPEGVVVKTYGAGAPDVIWGAVPKDPSRTEVIVPSKYDDEPDR